MKKKSHAHQAAGRILKKTEVSRRIVKNPSKEIHFLFLKPRLETNLNYLQKYLTL